MLPAKRASPMRKKPASIDAYLKTVTGERRAALEMLRRTIRSVLPEAEECISYSIPAFRVDGVVVAGFLATAKGCSYYPFSGKTLRTLAADLEGYQGTRGALHFPAGKPLPKALVRRLLRARVAEVAQEPGRRATPARSRATAEVRRRPRFSKKLGGA
jgi:uncharacterized protein YdhG (YjbR/CyaY superfamily)